jgi:hypothetical protein
MLLLGLGLYPNSILYIKYSVLTEALPESSLQNRPILYLLPGH